MRFDELFEQYGPSVPFRVPGKIAAIKPKVDFRQRRQSTPYRIDRMPTYVPTVDAPEIARAVKPKSPDKPVPIRVGKELIRPNDPRYNAIMSLLSRQKKQP